ncbi:hypothetical protein BDW71DRAFT_214218 [Aspergillus fruticulosus]
MLVPNTRREYLLELLYLFFLFTSYLSENSGPTVHKVYDVYNKLFDHLDQSINQLVWNTLSGLDKAFYNISKYQKLLPSTVTFKELKAYLDIEARDFLTVITNSISDILDNLTPDSITFIAKDYEDDELIITFYISKNKDIDNLEDDPEDGLLLEIEDLALPQSTDIIQT